MENSTFNDSFFETTEAPFLVYSSYSMRQIIAAMCTTTAIVGLIGNALVIIAVRLSKKLRTVTNVFVINLSISDLISCVCLPWEVVAVLGEDGWPLPQAEWLCAVTSIFIIISTGCSVTNLALIALNRWVRITKSPVLARRIYARRNIIFMVIFSWLMPLCVTLIPPLTGFGELGYEPRYSSCSWVKANPYSSHHSVIVGVFYFPIPLITIGFCYGSIFRYVVKTSRRMAQHEVNSVSGLVSASDSSMRKNLWKRQVKVTKNLVYVVAAFVICSTLFIFSFLPLGYDWSIRMTPYAIAIVYFNCITDPIIYATSHPDFKEAFGYMIRCRWKDIPQSSASSRLSK
ncbi:melatonin receptor type 1B-B-like [Patiria miniata]|uniref:G-protein coupled receptors family 1 profile domain-containing protein n=1 Tax=Patiria miniata TaxID=46514 RepID=A0A913Z0G2_PATMI|nr:melatonin receptor type 1B-B-like [Patiria miniata]